MEKFSSIRERLRKISLMLDKWVESPFDGVHRIHWKRIDSDGKVHFLFVSNLKNSTPVVWGEKPFQWNLLYPLDSNTFRMHFLFVTAGQKLSSCWTRWKSVKRSLLHQSFAVETCIRGRENVVCNLNYLVSEKRPVKSDHRSQTASLHEVISF